MANTPRGKRNQRQTTSTAKKPKTIDLDAKDVKSTPPADPKTGSATTTGSGKLSKSIPRTTPAIKSTRVKEPLKDKPQKSSGYTKTQSAKPAGARNPTSASTSKSDKPVPTPPIPANNNTGFGKLAAAGVVGALVTLGGAGAMQYNGLLPSPGGASQSAQRVDLTPLQSQIAALQSRLDGLGETPVPPIDLTPIETRISALEKVPAPASAPQISTETTSRLQVLKGELDTLGISAGELTTRLERLENVEPTALDTSAVGVLIDTAIAPLLSSSEKNATKFGELENQFSALTKKIDEEVDARINKFDEQLKNAATGEKLAKSVAINALKSAMVNGNPFSAALVSLETLTGPSTPLDMLKPYATTGIATGKNLLNGFRDLQSSILLAASNNPNAGLGDRVLSSIRSLVTISSDEALPGDSPEAVISRIEAALKAGDYGAAASEWQVLPEPSRQVSSSWSEKLNQRLEAERQMAELLLIVQPGASQSDG